MLSLAVAAVAAVVVVVLLALAMLAASACSCFLASLARRLRSASLLPLATRPGFLAGFVVGGSAVTLAGVGVGAGAGAGVGVGSSGIVSSGCEAIGYIKGSEFCKVSTKYQLNSCQLPARFLVGVVQASH